MESARPFDRTYEGLKQDLLSRPSPGVYAFDRTYEGLKLSGGVLDLVPHDTF